MSKAPNPASYFAWALNICLCGGASGIFVDLVPEDGVIREFSPDEETLLGQSLEKMSITRLRGFGTVSRVHCGSQTSPEVFYVAVAHAVRTVVTGIQNNKEREEREGIPKSLTEDIKVLNKKQQQDSPAATIAAKFHMNIDDSKSPFPFPFQAQEQKEISGILFPHIFIVQDVDRAPARTLECLTEMLAMKTLSVPPGMTHTGVVPDLLQLPSHFVVVATSTRVPRGSTTTSFSTNPEDGKLSDRLLNGFLLRVPIILPSVPVQYPPPERLTRNELKLLFERVPKVHISPIIIKHVRDTVSAVRSHPFIACGLPPRAADSLCLAMRVQAALSGRTFAIPEDYTTCVIESLAHRISVAPFETLPSQFAEQDPVNLARLILASVVSSLPTIK